MLPEVISEQKRFVRAEHWLRARYHLRARDGAHNKAWDVLIVAGPSPREEIVCIRELLPRAIITAIDSNEQNVLAAIDAGANKAFVCDLGRMDKVDGAMLPPMSLRDFEWDVICLDLTGPANDWLKSVVQCLATKALAKKGVMMVTFSYGRDVVERLEKEWTGNAGFGRTPRYEFYTQRASKGYGMDAVLCDCPEGIAARVWFALRTRTNYVETCYQYRGNKMPMVSCLFVKSHGGPYKVARFIPITPDDLPFAVIDEQLNLSKLYACPAERIEAFRTAHIRKEAARKAVETRKRRLEAPTVPLLTYEPSAGQILDELKRRINELPESEKKDEALAAIKEIEDEIAKGSQLDDDVSRLARTHISSNRPTVRPTDCDRAN